MKKILIAIVILISLTELTFAISLQSNTTKINDNYIHYFHQNNGKTKNLVLLTGSGTTANFWPKNFIEKLSENYNLYLLDYRCFNTEESCDDVKYSINALADDTNAFVKKYSPKNTYLLGWSMGGGVALQTVFDNPELYKHLFLLAPIIPYNIQLPRPNPDEIKNPQELYNMIFNQILYNYSPKDLEKEKSRFINSKINKLLLSKDQAKKEQQALLRWFSSKKAKKEFSNIKIPTTVFIPSDDKMLNETKSKTYFNETKNKNYSLKELKKSGHAVAWDKTVEVTKIINSF
ncbi:alpha/beta hydrolase [Francisella sp. Scap27]|uniref:alpha/beta fold hydrolase n=1 Tax=Francisella sp. Scap27 TaxID=2589986 RepID=UPI0015BC7A38|nr:alpha/beta hydrolase [Francisella sp. Scap27]QLE79820.1 alpha/beta hydrolase [Francisella sp. Scap27]